MKEVYILNIVKESENECANSQVSVYSTMESALNAYSVAVDEARDEAYENYYATREEQEIATDTYRFFRIYDDTDYESITIEVLTKEIIGDDSDDI